MDIWSKVTEDFYNDKFFSLHPVLDDDQTKDLALYDFRITMYQHPEFGDTLDERMMFLFNKYSQYIASVNSINLYREERYKKKILTISEWLKLGKWQENLKNNNKLSLDQYLYGEE